MSPEVHWQLVARGTVQGVGYRARVAAAARRHGVVGSATNRPDGTVFLDVQGTLERVEEFAREVRGRQGLSDARAVDRVAELAVVAGRSGFEVG